MLAHLWHLIRQSISYYPSIFSGTYFSVFIGPFLLYAWRNFGTLRAAWKTKSMKWASLSKDTVFLLSFYCLLFFYAIAHSVYIDHEALVTKIAQMKESGPNARVKVNWTATGGANGLKVIAVGVEVINLDDVDRSFDVESLYFGSLKGRPMPYPKEGPSFHFSKGSVTLDAGKHCDNVLQQPIPRKSRRSCWQWSGFDTNATLHGVVTISVEEVATGQTFSAKSDIDDNHPQQQIFR